MKSNSQKRRENIVLAITLTCAYITIIVRVFLALARHDVDMRLSVTKPQVTLGVIICQQSIIEL